MSGGGERRFVSGKERLEESMKYYMAIDIGASSGKHILGHLEGGKMIAEEIYRFSNAPLALPGTPGALGRMGGRRLIWNTERLFGEILKGLKKAGEAGKIPYSVGVDTWGVDYVLLDENDRLLEGTYCYRDGRAKSAVSSVHRRAPLRWLYSRTGTQFQPFNTLYRLYDDKRSGRLAKAKTFLMLPDYFHFLLTGVKTREYTDATTTGLIDVSTRTWDGQILNRLGYDEALFGPLSSPGEEIGEFTDEVAAAVGYKAKVILPATHDAAGAVLAAPLEGRTPYIFSGTWSLLGVERNGALVSDEARALNYSNEGGAENTFRLQRNIMGLGMLGQVLQELENKYDFTTISALARLNPIDDRIDVNDERFLSPPSMIAAIDGAVGKQLSAGGLASCIFNSLAKSYADGLIGLEKLTGEHYDTLNVIGEGSGCAFLNELTAKYTGRKLVTGPTECAAIGNLLMQMTGAGEICSVSEGREIVRRSFDIVGL